MIDIYNFIECKCPDAKHVFVFDPTLASNAEETKLITFITMTRTDYIINYLYGMTTTFKPEVLKESAIIMIYPQTLSPEQGSVSISSLLDKLADMGVECFTIDKYRVK